MDAAARPLRIALVSLHTSPWAGPGTRDAGGMNVVVRSQAVALGAAGHRVEVITRRTSSDEPDVQDVAPGVVLRRLTAGPVQPLPKGEHEGTIEAFRAGLAALGPIDVVHSHHWYSGLAALPVARGRGIPHVQSFHSIAADPATGLDQGERPEAPARLHAEARLARESDAVVAISAAEAATVRDRLGAASERVHVVAPGVDAVQFHPGPPPSPPGTLVAAARIEPLKGLDLAIRAVNALAEIDRPELIVAGDAAAEYTDHLDDLHRLAGPGVRFLGTQGRDDLAALLRTARAVLIPSHSETYGLVALEAAASGVPVVAAASGGLREAVVDGETGVVLDSRDPAVWAAAIADLLADPVRSARLGRAARERAETFSWERSAAGLVDVYREVIA